MFESRRAHHESSNRNASHFRRLDALRLAGESQCPHRLRLLFPYHHPNRAPAPQPAVAEWNSSGVSCERRKAAPVIARTRAELPNAAAAAALHHAAGCREDATLAFGIAPARCSQRERCCRSLSSAPAGARRPGLASHGSRHGLFSFALRAARHVTSPSWRRRSGRRKRWSRTCPGRRRWRRPARRRACDSGRGPLAPGGRGRNRGRRRPCGR